MTDEPILVFFDTETTGTDDEDRICQFAYKTNEDNVGQSYFFNPGRPISIGAMSVTHITNEMVAEEPKFIDHGMHDYLNTLFSTSIAVAHNAQFDIGMLEKEGILVPNSICTLKLAQTLDKKGEFEQYKLQYLRYWFGLKVEGIINAHDALSDVLVLEALFDQVLKKEFTIEEMVRITQEPVLLKKWPLGKAKGQLFEDTIKTDKSYFEWMAGQDWLSPDLRYTINHWVKA